MFYKYKFVSKFIRVLVCNKCVCKVYSIFSQWCLSKAIISDVLVFLNQWMRNESELNQFVINKIFNLIECYHFGSLLQPHLIIQQEKVTISTNSIIDQRELSQRKIHCGSALSVRIATVLMHSNATCVMCEKALLPGKFVRIT